MLRATLEMVTGLVKDGYFHQMTPPRRTRDLRASDADRERVVAVLAEAVADGRLTMEEHAGRVQRAYLARTLGDLAGLTEDLLEPSAQPLRLDEARVITAFFTTTRRDGRWIVPGRLTVTVLGGQVVLDLREAILADLHTIVHASLIGGRLDVLAPAGVGVVVTNSRRPSGSQPAEPPVATPGAPLIEIRAFTMAGRVRVYTPRRPGGGWLGRLRRPR